MQRQGDLRQDDILWLLGSLCGVFRTPFDATLMAAQANPPPYDHVTLHEAVQALGIKTGRYPLQDIDRQELPLPAIAFQTLEYAQSPNIDDSPTDAVSADMLVPLLIFKASTDQLLYFRPGSQRPVTPALADAATRFAPELILVAHDSVADETPGLSPEEKALAGRFGFSWFIPGLLKHKTIWRDVLIASLAIQFVGLTTPIFTQVIIDKVVVHQSSSMLIVLGVALVASSAAMTLILDFPFLLIFLAEMFAHNWQLSLIAIGLLGLIALTSLLVAPVFRDKLNRQFVLGARNQSFLTEYVCGKDIRYLAANELRSVFGVVPQETVLFSGTLFDNLVMAHPHATFDDVIAACKAAEIHEVIAACRLPNRDRRTRRWLIGRPEAAHRHRPGIAQATEDPDLRRSGLQPRPADG